uniref:Uncharacterized protein n=1 Tax=Anguilla anguilla TaxID=7936 RepID=A0A0E9SAB3_ANGAN
MEHLAACAIAQSSYYVHEGDESEASDWQLSKNRSLRHTRTATRY